MNTLFWQFTACCARPPPQPPRWWNHTAKGNFAVRPTSSKKSWLKENLTVAFPKLCSRVTSLLNELKCRNVLKKSLCRQLAACGSRRDKTRLGAWSAQGRLTLNTSEADPRGKAFYEFCTRGCCFHSTLGGHGIDVYLTIGINLIYRLQRIIIIMIIILLLLLLFNHHYYCCDKKMV